MKWTFIHPNVSQLVCLFVGGLRMNSGGSGTSGEEIEERRGRGGEGERRGGPRGQTNKQTTHRFPAALRHPREPPLASHHPVALTSTYVDDAPQPGGRGSAPAPTPRLVPAVPCSSLRDVASALGLPETVSSAGLHAEGRVAATALTCYDIKPPEG